MHAATTALAAHRRGLDTPMNRLHYSTVLSTAQPALHAFSGHVHSLTTRQLHHCIGMQCRCKGMHTHTSQGRDPRDAATPPACARSTQITTAYVLATHDSSNTPLARCTATLCSQICNTVVGGSFPDAVLPILPSPQQETCPTPVTHQTQQDMSTNTWPTHCTAAMAFLMTATTPVHYTP
jgi:hypothetical protein